MLSLTTIEEAAHFSSLSPRYYMKYCFMKQYFTNGSLLEMDQKPSDVFRLRLDAVMSRTKLSQAELARRVRISPAAVLQYRRGKSLPTLDTLAIITHVLETSSDYLLGLADEVRFIQPDELSPTETEICSLIHGCDEEQRQKILLRLKNMIENKIF